MHSHGEKIAIPVNDPRPTVVAGWFDQALMRHRTGDLVQAQVFYQRVLDVQPEHPEALNFLGILMQQRGQSVQAEQLIRRAIRAVPSYAAAYTNLGNILMVRRRYEDAIAAYRQATLCKMDEIDAWVNMGAVLRGLGRLPEALEAYRQALKSIIASVWSLPNWSSLRKRLPLRKPPCVAMPVMRKPSNSWVACCIG